jgi:hypothetical protein
MDRFTHQFDLLASRAQQSRGKDAAGRQMIPITQAEPNAPTVAAAAPTIQS